LITSKRPVWLLRIIMAIGAISCVVIFVPWLAACAYLAPLPDRVQQQVDDAVDYDLDGIVVYVDVKGQAPQFYSAGWKNRENKVPADPHALFKIGSISKLYIAAATAKLVKHQQLSLDDTLAKHLPELAGRIENADKITLKMLLQHRSGIPDWIDDPEFPWATSLKDVDEYLELVLDKPAEFEPDTSYDYSNTNYLLIGRILDKTLGYAHQDYIRSEILAPLHLSHTFAVLSDVDPSKVSSGYYRDYDGDVKMLDIVVPGGSMLATAQDTGLFLRALNDGTLFDAVEQDIYSSIYAYEHTGLWPGYSSIARYHKDIDAVVIQFVNTSGGNSWMVSEIVYDRIVKILHKH
jgi:D-alanyl-D-alanine carboxypeptidase